MPLLEHWTIQNAHAGDATGPRIECTLFSPDSRWLVSSGSDQIIRVWDVKSGKLVAEFDQLVGDQLIFVVQMAWLPSSDKLLVGGHSYIALVNLHSMKEDCRWHAHCGWVYGIKVLKDAKRFISIGLDCKLKYWDFDTDLPIFESANFNRIPQALAFAGTRDLCAIATGARIQLWDVQGRKKGLTLRGHRRQLWGLVFAPEGRFLASGGDDKSIRVWDVSKGCEIAALNGHQGRISAMAGVPNTNVVAAVDYSGEVRCWDMKSQRELCQPGLYDNREFGLKTVAVDSCGRYLAAGGYGGTIKVWKIAETTT